MAVGSWWPSPLSAGSDFSSSSNENTEGGRHGQIELRAGNRQRGRAGADAERGRGHRTEAAAAAADPGHPAPVRSILQKYKAVTAERLTKPEDGDWLQYRRTYDGWGYSPLSQINTGNVAKLRPVWTLATGVTEGHQAPPTVNNGVMFVATPGNQLLAIEAKPATLWRYKRPIPEDILLLPRPAAASGCGATKRITRCWRPLM
jgi:hypothetical protein